MRESFYILLVLGILIPCKQKSEPEQVENNSIEIPSWKIDLDTILEKNDPKNLDLSKHQLFIDTTRNSEFYKNFLNWKPHNIAKDVVSYYINMISKKYEPKKINIGNFPKQWVSLEKLNNEFVVYDPCDGRTTSFELTESAVIFYYQLEPDADLMFKLNVLNANSIELELRTNPEKIESEKTALSIKPTEWENVYLLTYNLGKWYVTPRERVLEFDLVVNYCPTTKRLEFNGFDEE